MILMDELHWLLEREWTVKDRIRRFLSADALIIDAMRHRRDNANLPPAETERAFLKRASYHLIGHCLDTGHSAVILQLAERDLYRTDNAPPFDENPFYWGLLAMFGDDSVINKDQRRLYSNQMTYAHRHKVPEHLLIGFLRQIGRREEIYEKVRKKRYEPWYSLATGADETASKERRK